MEIGRSLYQYKQCTNMAKEVDEETIQFFMLFTKLQKKKEGRERDKVHKKTAITQHSSASKNTRESINVI